MLDICENYSEDAETIRVIYLSVMNRDSIFLGKALSECNDLPVNIRLICAESEILDSDENDFLEYLKEIRKTDLIIVNLHGDQSFFKKYDRMMEIVESYGVDMLYTGSVEELNNENRFRFRHSDEDYILLRTLLGIGGKENHKTFLRWVVNNFSKNKLELKEPVLNRTEGIYHPDFDEDVTFEDYIKTLDSSKMTVGVMLHQTTWLKERRDAVKALIYKLEEMGVNTIPVFFNSSPDTITGAIGSEKTIRKYLMDGEKSRIDSLVICVGFSQVSLNNVQSEEKPHNFFLDLDVPVIQAMDLSRSVSDWEKDIIGLTSSELGTGVIWPEYDGQIISFPLSFISKNEDGTFRSDFVPDRVYRIADLAVSWARLRNKRASERKVAFLFNMYPPTNDRIGGAAGLDSLESVRRCLIAMKDAGYTIDEIPENGNEIVNRLLEGVTSDTEWIPEGEIEKRATALITEEQYSEWYSGLSEKSRSQMESSWGKPPGCISVHNNKFLVPGYRNGNVFIGIQPNRGEHEQAERLYHDPFVVMPHHYLAYYRWLKYEFGADCIVHMGTHGTLEWLPGKGNGLSSDCFPDVILDTMPNLYPYIIDDPGEGVQAKRRINAVLLGHMCPSMTRSGTYADFMVLEGKLQEYLNSRSTLQDGKRRVLNEDIRNEIEKLDMFKELNLSPDCSLDEVDEIIDDIYDYISDIKDALIKDGLHIFGKVPEGERMKETVYSLCRLKNGSVPSLRESIGKQMGFDIRELADKPSEINENTGEINGKIIDRVDDSFNELIDLMYDVSFDNKESMDIAEKMFGPLNDDLMTSLSFVTNTIVPSIYGIKNEITNFIKGMDGHFVEPGPSGAPTRGNVHLLPTGTNFYSIDPDAIPSEASWRIGSKMAEDMIDRYVKDNGKYPENVGIVIWATDTMKSYGDDVAYILALMGIRPTWGSVGGKVTGLEVIPHEELGRPRIDVMPRITGLFRDSFPGLTNLLVKATELVSDLDESDEINYYRKHLMEDIKKYISEGMGAEEAKDLASIRVFGDPPGMHGTGVSVLIASSTWDSIDQIADTYLTWGAYAYGGKWKGEKVTEAFKRRVGSLNVTVKNHPDREFDLLDIDDDYDSLGGMNAAVRVLAGDNPYSVMGDSSDPEKLKTRTLEEETSYVMRSRVLNPKWLEGLKEHGYKGAMELSKLTEFMLGWSATSDTIEPWMFKSVTEKFILDEETREWINENNPYAMKEMVEDFLEAINRGLWDAPEEMIQQLMEIYLDSEGMLEEINNKG